MKDILLKEEILNHSNFELNANQLFVLDSVCSTNLYCRELIKVHPCHETLVVANMQTAGKGRMGRRFFSPESTGIYMSLILDCDKISLNENLLTVAAGVAVCRVLETLCKIETAIKWVNDIFSNGKKVCGILAEGIADSDTNHLKYVILGIGINISTPDSIFPTELQDIAGSVFPQDTTRNQIIAQIVNELRNIYMQNQIDKLIKEYKAYSLILGKEINFTQNNKTYIGIATDINNEGNLIVRLENGEVVTLKSGEVSIGSASLINKV